MIIEAFVQQLTLDLGISESVHTDSVDHYLLQVDEYIAIEVQAFSGGFTLRSSMGKIPQNHCEEFFLDALHANLFGQGTGGATLGINDQGKLSLSLTVIYEMNYQEFRELVEDFANYVDFWQGELGKLK